MAVHDRLKPPTLEVAPTPAFFGLPLTLALAVLAAGFAYAMPRLQNVSADSEDPAVVVTESPTDSTPTTIVTPSPVDDSDDQASDEKADNHGKVVSTAAHCDVKGRAHGELVRSIAKDKEATVADAEAACAAALAAEATVVDEPKSNSGRGHSAKPQDVTRPSKPVKDPKDPATTSENDDSENDDSENDDSENDDSENDDSENDDSSEDAGSGKPDDAGKP